MGTLVYDRWVELYGETLDAFYPVAETEIGRLGAVYRASFPHRSSDAYEIQTRARALDNNLNVIAPNVGTYHLTPDDPTPTDTFGGHSRIADYLGRVVGEHGYSGGSSWVAGTIDIHALRHFRANAKWDNWMKDLTTEQYRLIYEQPVYPKNLYADRAPYKHDDCRRPRTAGAATPRTRRLRAAGGRPPAVKG